MSNLGKYHDIKQILDAALAGGGGKVECTTPGAATKWRHRAYAFRKAYREEGDGTSPWDGLTLVLDTDPVTRKATSKVVRVEFGSAHRVTFTPNSEADPFGGQPDPEDLQLD